MNLSWDSFKYRNYDYAIGRFMSVDPLAEKYPFWTLYAFSGNRIIDARELEGLEPHKEYKDPREAATNFAKEYNGLSIRADAEIGAQIYMVNTPEGDRYYSYTTPVMGASWFVDTSQSNDMPENAERVGDVHTHGSDSNNELKNEDGTFNETTGDNWPSREDFSQAAKEWFENNRTKEVYMFVSTPNGKLLEFIMNEKVKNYDENVQTVSTDIPSGPRSQTRANNVSPNYSPQVLPQNLEKDDYPEIPEIPQ
ncbi:MAG: DUF4329 domain-containing protein [Chlorobi bacterium]|nr:DUF4329 domain-containing protein [Chlorobiota bacterium]